ncbi:MAG: NYN domain-containing protein [Candidatus Thorarchaeota archaeon]
MAKRARCPHCDRLFNRDDLDRHIMRCRERTRTTAGRSPQRGRKLVIVDGNNVAYHLSPNGKPQVKNLLLAHHSLVSGGYKTVFVISAALVHSIDKPNVLQNLMNDLEVVRAQRGTNDDLKIITIAQNRNADILSNDRFLDWLDRYPWVSDRLRKYRMTPAGLILA